MLQGFCQRRMSKTIEQFQPTKTISAQVEFLFLSSLDMHYQILLFAILILMCLFPVKEEEWEREINLSYHNQQNQKRRVWRRLTHDIFFRENQCKGVKKQQQQQQKKLEKIKRQGFRTQHVFSYIMKQYNTCVHSTHLLRIPPENVPQIWFCFGKL